MQFELVDLAGNKTLLRVLAYIDVAESGCWNWTASRNPEGYGSLSLPGKKGRKRLAHRVSYEIFVGRIPDGMQIDHLCSNPSCVNPKHLEAVTPRENVLRGNTFAARQAAQTHCLHGHPLSGENLYLKPSGGRRCRTCIQAAGRKRRRAEREARPA